MKILLYSPASTVRRNGNRQTSSQWVMMLREAGHEVRTVSRYEGEEADILIALHALKSREAVLGFQKSVPDGSVILALTGTDIYPAPSEDAIDTMKRADVLVTLQRKAFEQVPEDCRDKVVTVIQSARTHSISKEKSTNEFNVAVVGHLRDVKDPLLAAKASRLLPASSTIRVRHVGGILESKYADLVAAEEKENPRYHWLGELSESETAEVIASSHLLVISSLSEGGARVVGEAIVHGTPVLSSRIDGVIGLVGDDYPGLFDVGGVKELAAMLFKAETEPGFYATLEDQVSHVASQFAPETEREAILNIVNGLGRS